MTMLAILTNAGATFLLALVMGLMFHAWLTVLRGTAPEKRRGRDRRTLDLPVAIERRRGPRRLEERAEPAIESLTWSAGLAA